MSNIYYWEKLTFWKLVGKVNLKENLKKCTSFNEQKGTRYIWRNVIVFSCHSSTRACLRFLLICFAREIKGFQSSLGNEVDFWDIINISLKNISGFSGWKSTDNNDINIFLSLENPFLLNFLKNLNFLLAKGKTWKRICNINSELLQNRTEKQIMPSKTTINWLFNHKWVVKSLLVLIEKLVFFDKQL